MKRAYWSETKRWPVEVADVPVDHMGFIPVWCQGAWVIVKADTVDGITTSENVECPDCQGRGWHTERQSGMSGQFGCIPCDGTGQIPENVEEPHPSSAVGPAPDWMPPRTPPPENVEEP